MAVVWVAIAVALFIVEMISTGFLAIWFAVGASLVAILLAFFPQIPLSAQILIFSISSLLLFFITKNKVKRFSEKKGSQPVYSILGKKALVSKPIDSIKGIGQISINGDIWSAKTDDGSNLPEGSTVEVLRIDGVKAVVKLVTPSSTESKEET